MKPYNYLSLLLLPLLVITGYTMAGLWNLLTPAFCFVIHPLISSIKKRNLTEIQPMEDITKNHKHFRFVILSFVPVLVFLFIWSLTRLSHIGFYESCVLAMATGTVNGVIGFTLAHEFIHRHTMPEKISGFLLLLVNNYLHYDVEHTGGHHVYACTPKDPHTARWGESFYIFLPRAIAGTYINAWEIQLTYLKRKGYAFFSLRNKMLVYTGAQLLLYGVLVIFLGTKGIIFFFVQSSTAIFLLHMINYLQHYGLARKEITGGKFEKIAEHHSWNSGYAQQAFNLFQLENHADHHMHPSHPYEELKHHHESPQLPGGYTTMICLALIPPLWFRMIHKRIFITLKSSQHEIID
ncbi:MAG: alkane 1-monooxygenase [Bacteroidota bacterium]